MTRKIVIHLIAITILGCPRCVPGAGARSHPDSEDPDDTEGDPWLALQTQVPEDERMHSHYTGRMEGIL